MALEQADGKGTTNAKVSLDSILPKWCKGKRRIQGLKKLAELLVQINSYLDYKQGPRDWCYTLENRRYVDKGEFDRAERTINVCREMAFLPIDFFADDEKRVFSVVEEPTEGTIIDYHKRMLNGAIHAHEYYDTDWWAGEKYYIQMLVEKKGLKSLFLPICEQFHIAIADAGGQSDFNQRYEMALRFKAAEERGQFCVLLYCGDFDPWGLKIGKELRKNIAKLWRGTGYKAKNLIIDRFGLNYDFIITNNLTWIDNLETNSGRDLRISYYCYNEGCRKQYPEGTRKCLNCGKKLYVQPPFVRDYITDYCTLPDGTIHPRKCEANALVVAPEQGRRLCREVIEKYLSHTHFPALRSSARR
jgi:hypothetical protein